MELLDGLYSFLKQLPFVGRAIVALVFIYGLNEVVTKATLGKINPLKSLLKLFPFYQRYSLFKKRRKYYSTLNSVNYLQWLNGILLKIYSDQSFTNIFDYNYPVVCFNPDRPIAYPFNGLVDETKLIINVETYKLDSAIKKEYERILGSTIKRPKLKGYMLSSIDLDSDNRLLSVCAHVGTYEQNVYTSHILEFELYKFYNKKIDIRTFTQEKILSYLPLRERIHNGRSNLEVLTIGDRRKSLLGVQAIILFKDHESNNYKTLVIKRSEDVIAKPGYYQFVPSGGFEIWQNHDNDFTLKSNFSIRHALFRELIEEVFGEEDYIDNEKGLPESNIINHPKVAMLIDLINKGEAHFEFLGSAVDLVGLRHELSFILRIDDPEFSKLRFTPNHESKNVQPYFLSDVATELEKEKEKLNQGSAGLLYMASQHYLFKEIDITRLF